MQPRLATEIRVMAILRSAQSAGAHAALLRRGHDKAGALYVQVLRGTDAVDLYGPAPGPGLDDEGRPRWARLLEARPAADAEALVDRHRRADPDLWLIEIEDRAGRAFLDGVVETDNEPAPPDPLIAQVFGAQVSGPRR